MGDIIAPKGLLEGRADDSRFLFKILATAVCAQPLNMELERSKSLPDIR
jgi:hypothetical protein